MGKSTEILGLHLKGFFSFFPSFQCYFLKVFILFNAAGKAICFGKWARDTTSFLLLKFARIAPWESYLSFVVKYSILLFVGNFFLLLGPKEEQPSYIYF